MLSEEDQLLPDEWGSNNGYREKPWNKYSNIVKEINQIYSGGANREKKTICYNELPIIKSNESLFLMPKLKIISRFGTEREYSALLSVLYYIDISWLQFSPKPYNYNN